MLIPDEEIWIVPITTIEQSIEYIVLMDASKSNARERVEMWIRTKQNLSEVGEPKTPYHVL